MFEILVDLLTDALMHLFGDVAEEILDELAEHFERIAAALVYLFYLVAAVVCVAGAAGWLGEDETGVPRWLLGVCAVYFVPAIPLRAFFRHRDHARDREYDRLADRADRGDDAARVVPGFDVMGRVLFGVLAVYFVLDLTFGEIARRRGRSRHAGRPDRPDRG